MGRRTIAVWLGGLVCAGLAASAGPAPAQSPASNALAPNCDRACLTAVADRYMAALRLRDPARVNWADHVRFSENNVLLMVGDGLWGTITDRGATELVVADPEAGEVGLYGAVEEHGVPGYFAMRLKVENGKVSEVETVVNRAPPPPPGAPAPFGAVPPNDVKYFPSMFEAEPPGARVSRQRLVDIANGYFSTLQQNDGTILTPFADDCSREENGAVTAGSAASKFPGGDLSCAEQFRRANYRGDSGVRDRGFMVVDEERQLVMTRMFLDHNGVLTSYTRPDGSPATSPFKTPSTLCALELFKIRNGKLSRVEAVYVGVPYHTPSVWRPAE